MDQLPEQGDAGPRRGKRPIVSTPPPSALEGDAAHQKRIVDALYRANRLMGQVADLKQLLKQIMMESTNVVGAEASSLMLYDDKTDELFFEIALGEKGDQVKVLRLKAGQGIAGACAQERSTLVVNDVASDSRHFKQADQKTQFKTRSILATPMVRKDRLIGVLELINKFNDQPFTDEDIEIVEFFAGHAAIAIENAMLVEANVRAERLAAFGQAIAGISHYVKNVLAGVQGGASLIDHALASNDLNLIHQAWPILQRSNTKIMSLVQDMLTYSKEREPELQRANLNAVADEVALMVANTAANSGVAVETHLAPEMPDALFDPKGIHDAVLNLVGNAIDATRGRPDAKVSITPRFDAAAKRISIAVEDNGPGIPLAIQKRLFEPFFSTKGSKGTGLGLAVTQKVVREHGGEISLHSNEGEGARFTIWLPYAEPEAEQ